MANQNPYNLKHQSYKYILLEVADILEQKNINYGSSYKSIRDEYGSQSFIIRLSDKFSRIKTIINQSNTNLGDESYEDSLKDLIGYCCLELEYLNQKKKQNSHHLGGDY